MRVVPDDPGRFFASHPALYRMSLAAAGGTAVYAAVRSVREVGPRRVPWMALAILEAAIVAGMVRRAASECRGMTRPATVDGLSAAEVLRRQRAGLTNTVARRSSRGAWAIVRANVLTGSTPSSVPCWSSCWCSGPPQDGLFGLVIVVNSAIGIVQELRANALSTRWRCWSARRCGYAGTAVRRWCRGLSTVDSWAGTGIRADAGTAGSAART